MITFEWWHACTRSWEHCITRTCWSLWMRNRGWTIRLTLTIQGWYFQAKRGMISQRCSRAVTKRRKGSKGGCQRLKSKRCRMGITRICLMTIMMGVILILNSNSMGYKHLSTTGVEARLQMSHSIIWTKLTSPSRKENCRPTSLLLRTIKTRWISTEQAERTAGPSPRDLWAANSRQIPVT